jgi:tetratricopeptide (TPR) repeat protein
MFEARRSTRRSLIALSCAALAATPIAAHAQAEEESDEAQEVANDAHEHFRAGIEHFNAGRYADAELSFSLGYELSRKPGFLWNIAEAARGAGANPRALAFYRRYLAEAPPDAPRLTEARAWVRALAASQSNEVPAAAVAPSAAAAAGRGSNPNETSAPRWSVPREATAADTDSPALYETWWFWAGASALIAGSVLAAVLVSQQGERAPARVPQGVLAVVDYR